MLEVVVAFKDSDTQFEAMASRSFPLSTSSSLYPSPWSFPAVTIDSSILIPVHPEEESQPAPIGKLHL
jgi:hypothetical protein